jgi:Oxidoreductase family, C-terminal alpha/beta domain
VKGDRFASESFGRMKEHLARNEVDVTKDMLTMGPALKFDPETERFIDNDEANALVRPKYREPFVVPEIS